MASSSSSSAPYWGKLPGPKLAQPAHTHRASDADDYVYNADRRSSSDTHPARRPNRASVHTQATEAASESTTFSPYESPTATSFAAQGLAPRPPSYQRGAHRQDNSSDLSVKKTRRSSQDYDSFDQQLQPPPPAAPDAPRGPPVSYRHPYGNGNGGLPHTFLPSGAPPAATYQQQQQQQQPHPAENYDDYEDYDYDDYGMENQEAYEDYAGYAGDQPSHIPSSGDHARRDSNAAAYDAPAQSGRVPSGTSGRRRKFAADQSPLQRLELTLDSMTKEEKRARVEAAEKRARERAARARRKSVDQQVRPRDRQASIDQKEIVRPSATETSATTRQPSVRKQAPVEEFPETAYQETANREAPVDRGHSVRRHVPVEPSEGAYHESTAREAPVERQKSSGRRKSVSYQDHAQYAPVEEPLAQDQHYSSGALGDPDDYEPDQYNTQSSEIPKRNLSFRERATRDNVPLPEQTESTKAPRPSRDVPSGGFSLSRSGSNKLKKEPPGDPWYRLRMEMREKHDGAGAAQRDAPTTQYDATFDHQPRGSNHYSAATRDKDVPPYPVESSGLSSTASTRTPHVSMPGDNQGIRRSVTEPIRREEAYEYDDEYNRPTTRGKNDARVRYQEPVERSGPRERSDSISSDDSHRHRFSNMIFKPRQEMQPGDGLYLPPQWLDEWKKATVGSLTGPLVDLKVKEQHDSLPPDNSVPWWEQDGRRRSQSYARPRKAEAFDGEYDENAPTRFKPQLLLKCGPLLRYCGIRRERASTRSNPNAEREVWRGSVMIVTQDSDSSYEIAPTLRLFVQDIELLPPAPHRPKSELAPEHVDPITGHPKVGRGGETLYVRPVEHLEEAKDISQDETDQGIFEQTRSLPDDGSSDFPGSFASRRKRVGVDSDGEKVQKYKDVRGFRLHAEYGYTFWRFNIEVELREKQQRIAYRINRGPATGFWVPAQGQTMNMMFYSCNGFSHNVKTNDFSGPDPMWRDVLNNHQSRPFHLMIGGGDQIYNDSVSDSCALFKEWLGIRNPVHKHTTSFTPVMQLEMEKFYLERYCMWYSQGLFGLTNSQIPMVNMYDDHDIYDGYGSYPHHDQNSPVFRGLGAVAFKYYMLFQQQSIVDETEATEPSFVLGAQPGPYIGELSRSLFMSVGSKTALLAVDTRTERTEHDVVADKTWEKIMNRLYAEVRRGQVEHLLVLLAVPIAYPRLVWLENVLTSRLMDPVKAIGRTGVLGKALNNIDGGVEVLDDLNDHWTAKSHKQERSIVIEDLQDLAIDKSVRITLLSGDVHLAAVGQFYSNPKLGLAKHKDPRYMPNVISSAIANAPPSDFFADVLNKRNKVHHFDTQTDEAMIPMFPQGVNGKPRNNKHLLPHRNWCSIREWAPGSTPPPSPPMTPRERTPSPPPPANGKGGGLLRRLSLSRSKSTDAPPELSRDSVRGPKPPVTRGAGGLFRSLSRRNSTSKEHPQKLTRSQSVDHGGEPKKRSFFSFGRRNSQTQPDDGGINGTWGDDDDSEGYGYDDDEYWEPPPSDRPRPSGLRGGALQDEYSPGDEAHFTAQPPRRAQTMGSYSAASVEEPAARPRPFHRTPTGLSTKQKRNAEQYEVDLEGGLDICLNVEVNPKDPGGATIPYRLLVPKLLYEYNPEKDVIPNPEPGRQPSGIKRFLSLRKKPVAEKEYDDTYESEGEEPEYDRQY